MIGPVIMGRKAAVVSTVNRVEGIADETVASMTAAEAVMITVIVTVTITTRSDGAASIGLGAIAQTMDAGITAGMIDIETGRGALTVVVRLSHAIAVPALFAQAEVIVTATVLVVAPALHIAPPNRVANMMRLSRRRTPKRRRQRTMRRRIL